MATQSDDQPPVTQNDQDGQQLDQHIRRKNALLLSSVFVVAVCGLIYELIAGAISSYLVGSSVTQFSLVIGLFMFAMGIGSFISRYVKTNALTVFVAVEIAVGITGGVSALLLFYAFTFLELYLPYLVLSSLLVGSLVGLEIPLVIRILNQRQVFSYAVSSVLALDYIGALLASLLFPLLLAPHLGLVRTGFLFGLLNVAVAGLALWLLKREVKNIFLLRSAALAASILLLVGLVTAGGLTRFAEDSLYQDDILLAKDSPYQRIVITRWRDDTRLYLNGHLQFSSVDEARYHESLVHVAMAAARQRQRVLVLGGGDGLAVREILKHKEVNSVDLVDLDPEIVALFQKREMLTQLNKNSLLDPRVQVHTVDAVKFLEDSRQRWDVVLIDLPDPSSPSLARLYSQSFYKLLSHHLSPQGVFVTQATSPFYAAEAFWCIADTIGKQLPEYQVLPYHVNVPSFGEWGFVLASRGQVDTQRLKVTVPTRFLTDQTIPGLFVFSADMQPKEVQVNRLDQPVIVRYYENGWRMYNN